MRGRGRIGLSGQFGVKHYRGGQLIETRTIKNLIVDSGIAACSGLIIQTGSTSPFAYIGIGTGTTAVTSTDIALETEMTTAGGERGLAALSRVTTDVTNDTAQLVKTFVFTTTGSYGISEYAVFNSTSSGATMLCRQTDTPITVVNTDSLQVTYKLDLDAL